MKQVIVNPERCVGCMQCMLACARVHSRSLDLTGAALETPGPRSRVHVGAGRYNEGFPNRCRHCDPAPCQMACLTGAIFRDPASATVLINPDRCINCASCAMACPYGVLRFHEDATAPPGRAVAVKCDNCDLRVSQGKIPACAEACKTGALVYKDLEAAMGEKTRQVARAMSSGEEKPAIPETVALYRSMKRAALAIKNRAEAS
ncbi:4Fe-4S dicluster domain-containing protein [Desulfospira joergensenii]|uniref:4Fe-4S dicluster domain-containing protein n=1 Tax=Desulfospira joergensenii TaxID=53329 RepID=UPI0003B3F0D2|nr:4Fe-4S dicluster domain-containing protein [Desulfospira joergensenii]